MPDTDEEPSVEPTPDQWDRGDDYTESARAARRRKDEDELHARQEADDAALRDEEELELRAKEDLERHELRDRAEVAEATRAQQIAFAESAEASADRHRAFAANREQRELALQARGQHKQDEAAARPEEPGADELAAEGRRNIRASELDGYQVNADDDRARADDELAREYRAKVQPDAVEAVRNPPSKTPAVMEPQERQHLRLGPGNTESRREPNRSATPDLNLDRER
ncbi:hypothetical protein GCM10009630_04270 [Kribbella jejuensis]|uniref:Uncharacterized protein n=1 Tax=Kribbella jejuensis TaxID=236068 RepID=A0A542EU30_9ACTN|nr:hypothetical protein [Kribbella jejuensis]TQJ18867.1 hypothetical protein FB475_3021 [Kribbella jejuensis]